MEEASIDLSTPLRISTMSLKQTSLIETMIEVEEQLDAGIPDSYILEKLTQNCLKSLQLGLVIAAKKEEDAFFYWEFPLWLSQTYLESRTDPSNACALISLSVAEAFFSDDNLANLLRFDRSIEGSPTGQQLVMRWHKVCPPELVQVMKDAITRGNTIYDEERKLGNYSVFYTGKNDPLKTNLKIPEAIWLRNRFVRSEQTLGVNSLLSWLFCSRIRETSKASEDHSVMNEVDFMPVCDGPFAKNLIAFVTYVIAHPILSDWRIFCFMVVCRNKAVSLVYSKDTAQFCFLDSHTHDGNQNGSIIAVSLEANFPQMAEWSANKLFSIPPDVISQKFELSLLQLTNDKAIAPLNPNKPIVEKIFEPFKKAKHTPSLSNPWKSLFSLLRSALPFR